MSSPWYPAGRRSHIHEITSSKIYCGQSVEEALATLCIPKVELVACLNTFIRTYHRSTDGSLTHMRTVLHDQCENSAVSNVGRFLSDLRWRYAIAEGVLSFPGRNLPTSYVSSVASGARKLLEGMGYMEFLRIKKIKLVVTICCRVDVVYDEAVAMRLAEMESEEEAARRRVKVAVETTLEEEEWEENMGRDGCTCTICLEEFCEGVKITRMPCSHYFHKECIWKWLVEECNSCPLCRCAVE